MEISFAKKVMEDVEVFASRTILPVIGGLAGTVALAPLPFGSLVGSALGSAYALKIHQQTFEGQVKNGALIATAAITLLSGGLAMSALMSGGVGLGLVGRSLLNVALGVMGRAGDAWDDSEDDTAWSWVQKTLLNYNTLADLVLGEAAHRVFGPLHAEARPSYRDKLIAQGHCDKDFIKNLDNPLPSSELRAGGYFVKRLATHTARRTYWEWASLGADHHGGAIGLADTPAGILRRLGYRLKTAENMEERMKELYRWAEVEKRPVIIVSPTHSGGEVGILAAGAFSGVANPSVRISMGSRTNNEKAWWSIYPFSSFLINRNDPEKAVAAISRAAENGLRKNPVAPLIWLPGSEGLGMGPPKPGYGHVAMKGVAGKTPLIGVLITTGTEGAKLERPQTIYGDFYYFNPVTFGVRAPMQEINPNIQNLMDAHIRKLTYQVHQRDWPQMALDNPEQFNRSMAAFYPLVKALGLSDQSLKSAVYKAHVADEDYVRQVILPLYRSENYQAQIQNTIRATPVSSSLLNKNIRGLQERLRALEAQKLGATGRSKIEIEDKITASRARLELFEGSVKTFLENLRKI